MSGPFDVSLEELRRRSGSMRQLARSEVLTFDDGPARGSRVVKLTTADGFDVEVLPDRGLDLGAVSWRGIPLAWLSPAGPMAPGLVEATTEGWNRAFGGGLLTTCGLDQFGRESIDQGILYPQHGRAHTLVASHLNTWSEPSGDRWAVGVSGVVRQATAFAENLRLRREVTCTLGNPTLTLRDRVTNDAHVAVPHMLLYHLNFGWPLVSESSSLEIVQIVDGQEVAADAVSPRDAVAERGLEQWMTFDKPTHGAEEEVFHHGLLPHQRTLVRLANPTVGIAAELEFSSAQLPHMFQWKLMGDGAYVLGIEPANSAGIGGRGDARESDDLPILQPGQTVDYELKLSLSTLK